MSVFQLLVLIELIMLSLIWKCRPLNIISVLLSNSQDCRSYSDNNNTKTTSTTNEKGEEKTDHEKTPSSTTTPPTTKTRSKDGSNRNGGMVIVSPRKTKSLSPNLSTRKSLESRSSSSKTPDADKLQHQPVKIWPDKTRSGTMVSGTVPSKSKTDKMDLEHQRLMRAKKIASEALKVIIWVYS